MPNTITNRNLKSAYGRDENDVKTGIFQNIQKAVHNVGDFCSTSYRGAVKAEKTLAREISSRPIRSGLVAVGLGFVIGSLFRR